MVVFLFIFWLGGGGFFLCVYNEWIDFLFIKGILMGKIGVGIIGCGGRVRHLMNLVLQQTSDIELVAVFDPDGESVAMALDMLNPKAKVYGDYHELAADPAVDWVMVGSWNCFHSEQAIAGFEAGKNVFCEKPLATNLDDCLAMRKAWLGSGKLFTIGFTLRFSPHYRRIKEVVESGQLGDIISMEFNEVLEFNHGGAIMANWRRFVKNSGSHILEKCCHDIDLANWMVGSLAVKAASFGGLNFFLPENAGHIERLGCNEKGQKAYGTWELATDNAFTSDKDIVDNQVVILEYANGVRATFHANCNSGIPERRMFICGTEGALRADVIAGKIEVARIGFGEEIKDVSTKVKGNHGEGDPILVAELVEAMVRNEQGPSGLDDGLKAAVTCFAIDEALGSGEVVDVGPMWEKAGIEY